MLTFFQKSSKTVIALTEYLHTISRRAKLLQFQQNTCILSIGRQNCYKAYRRTDVSGATGLTVSLDATEYASWLRSVH